MNTDVELLVREGLDRLTADAWVPAGMAGRVLARRRRRRVAGYATAATAAAAVAAAVVVAVATGGAAGPAATHARAAAGPALATAYVVRQVENALANDGQVMRETQSLIDPNGSAAFFDGRLSYESVTWAYQGRNNTETLGAHGRLQATAGTGIVNGKVRGVQVDYILHEWEFIPGYLFTGPANACRTPVFLGETGESINWPLVIERTLACGRFKMAGYAQIDGAETVKLTGSWVLGAGSDAASTITDTLFVTPSSYLPVRITQSTTSPGLHGSVNSADIQWLRPTAANRARATGTIPCGYQLISWPSGKPASGQPSSACR
jgi:hypothetical protein